MPTKRPPARRSSTARLAEVRFYFDADVLGLAKVVAGLRSDCTYPGDPGAVVHKRHRGACPITDSSTPDIEWIPEVARRGWLIITRDSRIQDHRAEIDAVRNASARMVGLAGKDAGSVWNQLEVLLTQWRRIEALLAEPAPSIYEAFRSGLTAVPLDQA